MGSHECWHAREGVVGKRGGPQLKVIKDVIISPYRNAYALLFEDGSIHDMTSYDRVEIK